MEKIRTFIAVEISKNTRKRACDLVNRLQRSEANVRWVVAENMHLTMKFLGDVPNTETPQVCRSVMDAVSNFSSIEIQCVGAGAFPDSKRPRTVWLGVETGKNELTELQQSVEKSLKPLGFKPERRRFHPHLTIGRVRSGGPQQRELAKLIEENASFEAGTSIIREVLILASFLDKTGPTYDVLGRAPLNG